MLLKKFSSSILVIDPLGVLSFASSNMVLPFANVGTRKPSGVDFVLIKLRRNTECGSSPSNIRPMAAPKLTVGDLRDDLDNGVLLRHRKSQTDPAMSDNSPSDSEQHASDRINCSNRDNRASSRQYTTPLLDFASGKYENNKSDRRK